MTTMMDGIARAMGWILRSLYDATLNYGLAIILFTVFIKLLLIPLSLKQQRSMKKTQEIQPVLLKMQEKHPALSLKELREKTNIYVADPDGIGSGHQTGAAIDLTICDLNKNCLDMGAKYLEADDEKTAMASKKIPLMAIKNRYLFKRVMEEAGFLNYPPEWWHFSYGEHEWAVLSGKHKTIYRAIKNPVVVLNKERQRG